MKMDTFKIVLVVLLGLLLLAGVCAGAFFLFYTPTLSADFSQKTGQVTNGASGYLYGLAEPGVPSENMTESIDISTVSQKVKGGLQHPVGDIDRVYTQLDNTNYNVIYLQDMYGTWYYENKAIMQARKEGTYDWQKFLDEDYFKKVIKSVQYASNTPYADKTVYCLYNECDNGVWFGETVDNPSNTEYGISAEYNEVGRQNFYSAWEQTYDLVRALNRNAIIGGPGFFNYDHDKIAEFLEYCKENDCLPDVMIYHELADNSIYFWQDNVKDYREIEKSLSIPEREIIVTEYGRMQDNGLPGKMLQFVTQIETSKVYGDNAFWRLANNLCDVAADDNSPNSNWWLYRWYTDMEGQTVSSSYHDLFRSNVGKAIKREAPLRSQGFMGIVSITDNEDKIEVICGGRGGDAKVKLKNLDETKLNGKTVDVLIETSVYKGLSGIVSKPVTVSAYQTKIKNGKCIIDLKDMDEANAYHIVLTVSSDAEKEKYVNNNIPKRFEFESGTLLGEAYTYDSAYATTGEQQGMVGGIEKDGFGVALTFDVPTSGEYNLEIIYGKANDGETADDRCDATANLKLDDKESEKLSLRNTIKSEYTDCYKYVANLTKGQHTITLTHDTGTYVLDSLLVSLVEEDNDIAVLADSDRTNETTKSFLAVAPLDGYYDVTTAKDAKILIDKAKANTDNNGKACAYLRRGLNYIDVTSSKAVNCIVKEANQSDTAASIALMPSDAALSGTAKLKSNGEIDYIDSITCNSGSAVYTVNAKKAGTYRMTILYANNDEGGTHDYNVDLIERYVTIETGGKSMEVYCRNTYSWDTFKTVTVNINLKKGENKITLGNSGKYKFNNKDTSAPLISTITVNSVSK